MMVALIRVPKHAHLLTASSRAGPGPDLARQSGSRQFNNLMGPGIDGNDSHCNFCSHRTANP